MRVELGNNGCTLYREPGDARIAHESTVTFKMKQLLNAQGHRFVRMYPDRVALTACRQGLIDHKAGIIFWHERYAIEDAAEEFNKSKSIWYMRQDVAKDTPGNRRLERAIKYLLKSLGTDEERENLTVWTAIRLLEALAMKPDEWGTEKFRSQHALWQKGPQ